MLKMVGDVIVTFKFLWRSYGGVVVWCYNTWKFLVFNHAKLSKIEYESPACSSRAGLKLMQLHLAPRLWGPAPWCLVRSFIFSRYRLRSRLQ